MFDQRMVWVTAAVFLAGAVRGVSGFGQALIFVPLAGLFYRPSIAVPLLWVLDAFATPLALRPHLRNTDWAEVLRLAVGGALTLPVGVWLLSQADPMTMRWVICGLVLASTVALASGWRLQTPGTAPVCLLLGGVSGLAGGATGMSGPPLVLSWLGRRAAAARIRSNIFIYLWLLGFVSLTVGAIGGLLTSDVLLGGMVLAPLYAGATLLGNHSFRRASRLAPHHTDALFRWMALGLCGASALAGLPLWHH